MTQEFNSDDFVNGVQNEEVSSKFTPVPENMDDGYEGYYKSGSIKVEPVAFKDGREGKRFTAQVVLADQRAIDATGMTEPTVRDEFLLDLTDGGALATGTNKNIKLGKRIEAAGLPKTGWSLAGLVGPTMRFKVKHRADKNDPEIKYSDIAGVTKL